MSRGQLRSVSGDEDAAIFAEVYDGLRRFAAVVGTNEIDPDDLVQEALARTMRRLPLRDLDDPAAYLRTVIYRLAANGRRADARRVRAFDRLRGASPMLDEVSSEHDALGQLDALAPLDRAILWLVVVEGMPFEEVAAILGCSASAARMRKLRAIRRLRELLEADGE